MEDEIKDIIQISNRFLKRKIVERFRFIFCLGFILYQK